MSGERVYELAGGQIELWLGEGGSIMLKVREPFGDPVELSEHEAEVAAVLERLAEEAKGSDNFVWRMDAEMGADYGTEADAAGRAL
jgi:hypothetical protein